jgi:hemolysin-activating ACP:hemolysin acyltransferase
MDRYRRQKLKEEREWQNSAEDFTSGAEVSVIDLVAPYGGVRGIVRDMRRELSLRYPNRHADWIRNNMTAERRLGRGERESARAES